MITRIIYNIVCTLQYFTSLYLQCNYCFQIVFESQQDYPNQKDRPKSLHIQTSRASITNVRSSERSSRADLVQCLNAFQMGQMFFGTEFPNKSNDFLVVTDKFLGHCAGKNYYITRKVKYTKDDSL